LPVSWSEPLLLSAVSDVIVAVEPAACSPAGAATPCDPSSVVIAVCAVAAVPIRVAAAAARSAYFM
jgi:hypothetical protein